MSKKVPLFALTGFLAITAGVAVIGFGAGAWTGSELSSGPSMLSLTKANALVAKLTDSKAKVVKVFKAPQGLTGMVIQGSNGRLIGWMTNTRSAVIIGNVVNDKNQNLTDLAAKTELNSAVHGKQADFKASQSPLKISEKALEPVSEKQVSPSSVSTGSPTSSVSNGESSLKNFVNGAKNGSFLTVSQPGLSGNNTIYAFVDPNCIFCHHFFDYVQNNIGKFQKDGVNVVYLPVAILKQSSINKAAEIAKEGWPALLRDEVHFHVNTEEGGLRGLTGNALVHYSHPVKTNTEWLNHLAKTNGQGDAGTPFLVWKTATGRVYYLEGYPNQRGFASIFDSMKKGWTPPKS